VCIIIKYMEEIGYKKPFPKLNYIMFGSFFFFGFPFFFCCSNNNKIQNKYVKFILFYFTFVGTSVMVENFCDIIKVS
jgi:hypothetical protein